MRRFFLAFSFIVFAYTAPCKSDEIEVSGFYNRAGYSLIVIDNKEYSSYSRRLKDWVENHKPDHKFYYNKIKSVSIEKKSCYPNAPLSKSVKEWLVSEKIGQQIVSVLFNRQENGEMDDSVVKARGLYNATATQEMDASAAALGKEAILQDAGYLLLDKNYVQILNMYDYKTDSKEGLTETTAHACGSLYRLVLTEDIIDDILQNMWIYPDDTPEQRQYKQKLFDDMTLEFELVTTKCRMFECSGRREDNNIKPLYDKIHNEFSYNLQKSTEDFIVQVPIKSTQPIKAQVGEKESLYNGARYDAYKHVMRGGEIKPVKTAVLRATTITDNRSDNTKVSEFIQVAGYHVEEGYILRQHNDRGFMFEAIDRRGGLEGYGINYLGISHIKTNGDSGFGGLYLTYMPYDVVSLGGGNIESINANEELYEGNWVAIALGLRIGFTRRFLRYFEAGGYVNIGLDMLSASYNEEDEGAPDDGSGCVFTTTPGATLKVNILYPLHLVLGIDYSIFYGLGTDDTERDAYTYNSLHNVLKDVGVDRRGLGYMIGLSYNF